jgi:hypothetical protein
MVAEPPTSEPKTADNALTIDGIHQGALSAYPRKISLRSPKSVKNIILGNSC